MKEELQARILQETVYKKRPPLGVYLSTTFLIFFLSLSAADSIGFVPDYIDGSTPGLNSSQSVALSQLPQLGVTNDTTSIAPAAAPILPTHISIPSVGIDLPVQNPTTTDVDTLDNLLKQGPARYVNSAGLGQTGTMIIFAHSSHLPIVINKMFQAFNQIPNVQSGDTVTLTGADGNSYLYSVESVVKADVNNGTTIDTTPSLGTRLVLVTCDTLTGTSARFVLTADFVGVVNNSNN